MSLTAKLRGAAQQQAVRAAAPVPIPPEPVPSEPTLWVDISNWTGELTPGALADLRAAGYVGAVVQAITGIDGRSYTRQQLALLLLHGFRIAGYVWCFKGVSPASMRQRLAMFDGYALEFLALDIEELGTTRADVDRDLALCDAYIGRKAWIYTGKWVFDLLGWSSRSYWADRELWDSRYNGTPVVGVGFQPYGGWTWPRMSQFAGTSRIGRLDQVDLNVLAP